MLSLSLAPATSHPDIGAGQLHASPLESCRASRWAAICSKESSPRAVKEGAASRLREGIVAPSAHMRTMQAMQRDSDYQVTILVAWLAALGSAHRSRTIASTSTWPGTFPTGALGLREIVVGRLCLTSKRGQAPAGAPPGSWRRADHCSQPKVPDFIFVLFVFLVT